MFSRKAILLILIICITFWNAILLSKEKSVTETEQPISMANLEGDPSAFVHGCVNIITGQFCDFNVDLEVNHGVNPITIERSYAGNLFRRGKLCRGWCMNHSSSLFWKQGILFQDHGGELTFEQTTQTTPIIPLAHVTACYKFTAEALKEVTNNASGTMSGQTNLKNYRIGKFNQANGIVGTGSGDKRVYRGSEKAKILTLFEDNLINRNRLQYQYTDVDDTNILSCIRQYNSQNREVNALNFPPFNRNSRNPPLSWQIITADGRWVKYNFVQESEFHLFLANVENSSKPKISYQYALHWSEPNSKYPRKPIAGVLASRSLPDNRYLNIEYYHPQDNSMVVGNIKLESRYDVRLGRVKKILAPAGSDEKPIPIYQFVYGLNSKKDREINGDRQQDKLLDGSCEVYNANGHKTTYVFTKQHRLSHVLKFHSDQTPYTTETLYWGDNHSSNNTHLLGRSLNHIHHGYVFARTYQYDDRGNILVDAIYGNLSGHNKVSPHVSENGTVHENGCECYRTSYSYSNDGLNLLLQETDGIKTTTYQYHPDNHQVIAKLQTSGGCHLRWFYTYNDDAAVIKEIHDDGFGQDPNDLSGVTERYITDISQCETYPVAYPLIIEKKCLDLTTGQEVLIHKTVNHYAKNAKIKRQDHYDNQGHYIHSLYWEYDDFDNMVKEVDALDRLTERRYDANNNCIYEQGPNLEFHKRFTYDYMNRLIKEEEIHNDGINHTISHRYDLCGRRVATIDINGNETRYNYDPHGRLIQTIFPTVLNEYQQPCQPTLWQEYDPMGNVIKTVDAKGIEINKTYTLRGQIASIRYPDGTSETKVYHLDGSLKESTSRIGIKSCFTNDMLGRPTEIAVYAKSGEFLYATKATYNGFHVLTETDPAGSITYYEYYPDGNLKSKRVANTLTKYVYDGMGRVSKTINVYGPGESDVVVEAKVYNNVNQVVEERVEDASKILTRVTYQHDISGNIMAVTRYPENKPAITTTKYNSHGVPVTVTDPLGNVTRVECLYNYRNTLGQCVACKNVIDPLGNTTTTIEDALGRKVCQVRKNAFGQEIQKYDTHYDLNGNPCRFTDTIFNATNLIKSIDSLNEYDTCNRLIATYEAIGTPEQKQTKLTYNTLGQKASILKNDGVHLDHTYDALGRLSTLSSSDHTIHYVYHYDVSNNPILVEDLIQKTQSMRTYDKRQQVVSEKLAHGLSLNYTHDYMGRTTQILFPDNSGVNYRYNACFMKSVERIDRFQNPLYEHLYENFDQAGQINLAKLIGNAGELTYQYDVKGRLTETSCNGWNERLTKYDALGNLQEVVRSDESQSIYTYDALSQLTSEQGLTNHVYNYDSHYNRLAKDGHHYTLNALHQLTNTERTKYSYDLNGNLIKKEIDGITYSFAYDALDRLITFSDGQQQVSYFYDENNRRLTKKVRALNPENALITATHYLYQGQNEIGACDEKGQIKELRLLGIGKGAEIGAAIALELEGVVYAPIHDHNGSLVCLLDLNGQMVDQYAYSAYGESLQELKGSWGFASKRFDAESGLIYFGRRYYDPEIGRWISQDPLGREAGPNLYAYVSNNPLNHFDLYGLIGQHHGFKEIISNKINKLGNALSRGFQCVADFWRSECPIAIVRDVFSSIRHFCKNGTLRDYKWEFQIKCGHGVKYGTQLHPQLATSYTSGMNNTFVSTVEGAQAVSATFGDSAVGFVNNEGHGNIMGVLETVAMKAKIQGQAIEQEYVLTKELLNEVGPDGVVRTIGFSQGGQIIYETQSWLTESERMQMHVETYGSAKMIPNGIFGSAINYVSVHDPVPFAADSAGILRGILTGNPHIVFLDSEETPFLDHKFLSPTYQEALKIESQNYLNRLTKQSH